jgi:hypothetical protein
MTAARAPALRQIVFVTLDRRSSILMLHTARVASLARAELTRNLAA